MTPVIECRGLSIYRGGRPVVLDLSLAVPPASWLGVVGANGSGKTSLLRAIGGRLPIAAGECRIGGSDLANDRSARARAVGFAPPSDCLPGALTIGRLLELAGEPLAKQRHRNDRLWAALGIAGLLETRIGAASSGMRQRAAIACAFAEAGAIVLLDEPFNWLDPVAAFDTRAALQAKVASGITLVTALHDLPTLCGFCDAGVMLGEGRAPLRLDTATLRAGARDITAFETQMIAALRGYPGGPA